MFIKIYQRNVVSHKSFCPAFFKKRVGLGEAQGFSNAEALKSDRDILNKIKKPVTL